MANETKTTYTGRWRRLINLSAQQKGSIHDDEQAREMGFRGGFVVGSTVATAAMPAIVELLGQRWLEGGWCSFTFLAPVYDDEEVQEAAETFGEELELKVVSRAGTLCCAGRAGFGFRAPWDKEQDGRRGAENVFPEIPIGREVGETEFVATAADVRPMLDSAGDTTPWYDDSSPWGGGVVPAEWLHRVALAITRQSSLEFTGVREPRMWAEHQVALAEPLHLGKAYRMREWVADKGVSSKTLFMTYEFEVYDGDRKVAIGRHKQKWFPA